MTRSSITGTPSAMAVWIADVVDLLGPDPAPEGDLAPRRSVANA